MKTIRVDEYSRGAVRYARHDAGVRHNVEHDYQIILLEGDFCSAPERHLDKTRHVVAAYALTWTREHVANNKRRLGIPSDRLTAQPDSDEIRLTALVVRTEAREYRLSSAGTYCLDNKYGLPDVLSDSLILHSDGIERFFYYAALLVGPDCLADLASPVAATRKTVRRKDLMGAAGWDSFSQMFCVANLCADWLVIRNFDFLPDDFWGNDKDLDILCRELDDFTLAINAVKRGTGISSLSVLVESREVDVDARFLGDDYYDCRWQNNMLLTKVFSGAVPTLDSENHFYSLLYHARIHKSTVKPAYVAPLAQLASELGVDYSERILFEDMPFARFIDAYLEDKGYKFVYPSDAACYHNLNRKVTRHLTHIKPESFDAARSWRRIMHKLAANASDLLPQRTKELLKRALRR